MKIKFYRQATKTLKSMDRSTRARVASGISGIPQGDIKRLQGHDELYRLRIGDWRIVFSYYDKETVLIEKIAPRGGAYKGG